MFRRRPSPATAISLLALFVALGGTTYAAATIGSAQIKNNSIRSKDIRKGAVATSDIKTGGVRSVDVKNRSLRARDFRTGELPSGPQGAQGPPGPKGETGPAGPLVQPEPYREVGTHGQPAFGGAWTNDDPCCESTAAFYKDPFGVVRLKGTVRGGDAMDPLFALPAGYRPAKLTCLGAVQQGFRSGAVVYESALVCIAPDDGEVRLQAGPPSGDDLFLEGITFRAGTG